MSSSIPVPPPMPNKPYPRNPPKRSNPRECYNTEYVNWGNIPADSSWTERSMCNGNTFSGNVGGSFTISGNIGFNTDDTSRISGNCGVDKQQSQQQSQPSERVIVSVIGNQGVGKSMLIHEIVTGQKPTEQLAPTVLDVKVKYMDPSDNKYIEFREFTTKGPEKNPGVLIGGSNIVVLVDDGKEFSDEVNSFLSHIERNMHLVVYVRPDVVSCTRSFGISNVHFIPPGEASPKALYSMIKFLIRNKSEAKSSLQLADLFISQLNAAHTQQLDHDAKQSIYHISKALNKVVNAMDRKERRERREAKLRKFIPNYEESRFRELIVSWARDAYTDLIGEKQVRWINLEKMLSHKSVRNMLRVWEQIYDYLTNDCDVYNMTVAQIFKAVDKMCYESRVNIEDMFPIWKVLDSRKNFDNAPGQWYYPEYDVDVVFSSRFIIYILASSDMTGTLVEPLIPLLYDYITDRMMRETAKPLFIRN